MLHVEHADPDLARMDAEPAYRGGFDVPIHKAFKKTMQWIRSVSRKNQLYQFNGLQLKRVQERPWQDEMRLNQKWRLIVEFSGEEPNETIRIIEIRNHL